MGGRGTATSGGKKGKPNTPDKPKDWTDFHDQVSADVVDNPSPPYQSSTPLPIDPATTEQDTSLIGSIYDAIVGLATDVIEAIANRIEESTDEQYPNGHPLKNYSNMQEDIANGVHIPPEDIAAVQAEYDKYIMDTAMAFGPGGIANVTSTVTKEIIEAIITKTESIVIPKLSWREASELLEAAATKVGGEVAEAAERWALKGEAALGRMDIPTMEAEVSRVGALGETSDIITKYENTLLDMIKRERLTDLGKKQKPNPDLPPSTYRQPEPDLAPINERINTPPETPVDNTVAAITEPLPTIPPSPPKPPSLTDGGINITGSREVPASARAQVQAIAEAIRKKGCPVTTGCATGVDEIFQPIATKVNAQFGPNGEGAFSKSNVPGVQAAEARGAQVDYYSGGDLNTPLNSRLYQRAQQTALDNPTTLGIITTETSKGTVNTMVESANSGRNVFAINTTGGNLPSLGSGHWQEVTAAKGIWRGLSRWVPEQGKL